MYIQHVLTTFVSRHELFLIYKRKLDKQKTNVFDHNKLIFLNKFYTIILTRVIYLFPNLMSHPNILFYFPIFYAMSHSKHPLNFFLSAWTITKYNHDHEE
jgi:hypothetical protein